MYLGKYVTFIFDLSLLFIYKELLSTRNLCSSSKYISYIPKLYDKFFTCKIVDLLSIFSAIIGGTVIISNLPATNNTFNKYYLLFDLNLNNCSSFISLIGLKTITKLEICFVSVTS
jgi:hypothetical protein